MILYLRRRLHECINRRHDIATILYISSLIIAPRIVYMGRRLIDEIRHLTNLSPANFICVVRTTAPSYFRGRRGLMRLQKQSIELLRDTCYVVIYSRRREFLNHAKFLIFYHVCFSEGKVYHGKYYGSTNLTMAGLAGSQGPGWRGNYEEFTTVRPGAKSIDRLSRYDAFYLEEVLRLITHKASLYTDPNYLRSYLTDHLVMLEAVLEHSRKVVSGTTLGELYRAYVDLLYAYNQTYALLDEIPGKKLTMELKDTLMKMSPPVDPFELEVMTPVKIDDAEVLAKDLELRATDLRESIMNYIGTIIKSRELLEDRYLPMLDSMDRYFDEKEWHFLRFVRENGRSHRNLLKKLIDKAHYKL